MCGCILPACVLCLGGKVEVCGWSSVGGDSGDLCEANSSSNLSMTGVFRTRCSRVVMVSGEGQPRRTSSKSGIKVLSVFCCSLIVNSS